MQNLVVMKYLAYYFYMQVYFFRLFFSIVMIKIFIDFIDKDILSKMFSIM